MWWWTFAARECVAGRADQIRSNAGMDMGVGTRSSVRGISYAAALSELRPSSYATTGRKETRSNLNTRTSTVTVVSSSLPLPYVCTACPRPR